MASEAVVEATMNAAPAVILGRCNPYGAETGGPKRVFGGLHGPASARLDTDGVPGLPDSVIQGEWICRNPAQVRVRMVCRCGHKGEIMELCSWHDEDSYRAEYVAGTFRQVRETVKVRGHYEEISRRQAGACIRCLFPGAYAEWYKSLFAWQQELAYLREAGMWLSRRAVSVRQKIEDIVKEFDQGNADGTIHRCPMQLVPVS
jgi:hypothetical protein